jgi:hypothetical protein
MAKDLDAYAAPTTLTACFDRSIIDPISRWEWPLAASRLTSRSSAGDNRFGIDALLDELPKNLGAHQPVRRSLESAQLQLAPP